MSLFSALSSTVLDEHDVDAVDDGLDADEAQVVSGADELVGHLFDLPPAPPLAGQPTQPDSSEKFAELRGLFVTKRELRDRNADRARTLARLLGWEHRAVNGELNRRSGVHRITEATADQLKRRLKAADAWLEELTGA